MHTQSVGDLPSVNSNTSLSDNLQLNNYYDKLLFKNNSGKSLVDLPSKLRNSELNVNVNANEHSNSGENNELFRNYINKIDNLKNFNSSNVNSSSIINKKMDLNEINEEDPISNIRLDSSLNSTLNDFDLIKNFNNINLHSHNNNSSVANNFRNNSISVIPNGFHNNNSNSTTMSNNATNTNADSLHNFSLSALDMMPSISEPYPMTYNENSNTATNNNNNNDNSAYLGINYNSTIDRFNNTSNIHENTSNLNNYSNLFNLQQNSSSDMNQNIFQNSNQNNDIINNSNDPLNMNIENARRSSYISDSLIHGQQLQNSLESSIDNLNSNSGFNQYSPFNNSTSNNVNHTNTFASSYLNYTNNTVSSRVPHRNSVFAIPTHQATPSVTQERNYSIPDISSAPNPLLQQNPHQHQLLQQQNNIYVQNLRRNSHAFTPSNSSNLAIPNNVNQNTRYLQYNQQLHSKNRGNNNMTGNNHNANNNINNNNNGNNNSNNNSNKYIRHNSLLSNNNYQNINSNNNSNNNNNNMDTGLTVVNGRQVTPSEELKKMYKECGSTYFSSSLVYEFTDNIKSLLDPNSEKSEKKDNCIKFLNFLKSCNSNYVNTNKNRANSMEQISAHDKKNNNSNNENSAYMNYDPLALVTLKNGKLELLSIPNNTNFLMSRGNMIIIDGDRGKDLALMVEPAVSFDLALFIYFLKKKIHFDSLITSKSQHYPNSNFIKALMESTGGQSDKLNSRLYDVVELTQLVVPSKQVIRFATPWEVSSNLTNKLQDELKALHIAKMKLSSINNSNSEANELTSENSDLNNSNSTASSSNSNSKLNITILNAEIQFDRKKLTFYYICDERNDFRDLIKELFKLYKTRIWLCAIPNNLEIYSKYYDNQKKELHLYQQMMQNYANEDMPDINNNNIQNNNKINNAPSPFNKIELDNFQIGVYKELVNKLFE